MSMPSRRHAVVVGVVALLLASTGGVASAHAAGDDRPGGPPELVWAECGTTRSSTADGVQCSTAALPLDHDQPGGPQVRIAVARVPATDPANRIGSLFLNFGGPGATTVDVLQALGADLFPALSERFDLVGFDPRGVGQSSPAIDCRVDQETQGIYSVPVPTPLDIDAAGYVAKAQAYVDSCLRNNGQILEHVSTANVARDMDLLRAAVGDERLTYLGFSYGTVLGSTYAGLFPDRYRAMVLDGPVDAEGYFTDPIRKIAEQTAGFELALTRFADACAADQAACAGFGGPDPLLAYDALVAAADRTPVPADGYPADPRPVTGDEIRIVTASLLYSKTLWDELAAVLGRAAAGDGGPVRAVIDQYYGRRDDGTSDPGTDAYFAIGAGEQQYPRGDVQRLLDRGAESWAAFPHFWYNSGYAEINYTLWPVTDEDAYYGPFTVPQTSPTPLVIATTYDPATPYPGGLRLVEQLGNARLLTLDGDGHTAYGQGGSPCVDAAAEAYLIEGTLPPEGTVCRQELAFAAAEAQPAPAGAGTVLPLTGGFRLPAAVGGS